MEVLLFILGVNVFADALAQRVYDPDYAAAVFQKAVAGIDMGRDLRCTTSEGWFFVRAGDVIEVSDEYAVVVDTQGNEHTLTPLVADPICVPMKDTA